MLGKIEGRRRKGQQRMRWSESITISMDMNFSKLWEIVEDKGVGCAAFYEVAKRLNNNMCFTLKYALGGLMLKLKLQYFGHLM